MDEREKLNLQLEHADENELKGMLIPEKLPRHVAIIMDGNGRWARQRNLQRVIGHRNGIKSVRAVVEASAELKLGVLTLYAFSVQNWGRPRKEIDILMDLLAEFLVKERPRMMENNIRLMVIGRINQLPDKAQSKLYETIERTSNNSGLILNLALNYGGHTEICDAAKSIAQDVLHKKITFEEIDEKLFSRYLYTTGLPDPDLLIRTSGEMRISNFLLWQLAYAEFWITPVLWPDFGRREFYRALIDYQYRERRFGKVTEK
ncbi:MAG: isoprenyl transferase [bacterium]